MLPLLIAGLSTVGGFFAAKKLSSNETEKVLYKTQAECLELAKQGKIDPKLCLETGPKSFISEVAHVTEEIGKVILGVTVAYATKKILEKRKK